MSKSEKKPAGQPQIKTFKRVARELGADESERAIEDKPKQIAKRSPSPNRNRRKDKS